MRHLISTKCRLDLRNLQKLWLIIIRGCLIILSHLPVIIISLRLKMVWNMCEEICLYCMFQLFISPQFMYVKIPNYPPICDNFDTHVRFKKQFEATVMKRRGKGLAWFPKETSPQQPTEESLSPFEWRKRESMNEASGRMSHRRKPLHAALRKKLLKRKTRKKEKIWREWEPH